eukprot:m.16466 g.16466  ORF g.16466 m.16466 type:complete len:176 (-) comp5708_c0_seq1:57-584(-)
MPESEEHRGIPEAEFIEDVPAVLKKKGVDATKLIEEYDTAYQKYKFMESQLRSKQHRLTTQITDIKSTLGMLTYLQDKKGQSNVKTDFRISDALFVKATIPSTETVALWLGANVMLEYPVDEAHSLLQRNFTQAETNLKQIEIDMDFLRDQITTTEVNMARVYNHDVSARRAKAN